MRHVRLHCSVWIVTNQGAWAVQFVWKTPMVAFRGSNVRLCLMNFGKLPLVLRFSEEEPRGQGEFSWNSICLGADFISRGRGFQPNTREKRICRVLTKCPSRTSYYVVVLHATQCMQGGICDVPPWTHAWAYIRPSLDGRIWPQNSLYRIPIPHHIKMPPHIWSTKYRWNKKLIAQFYCTLRDEHFKPN
jgi:hypothetical protein